MKEKFWKLIYRIIFLPLFFAGVSLGAFFNSKIRAGMRARKNWDQKLIKDLARFDRSDKLIWFHSSSLGEFEQAKPIIESLKSKGKYIILVTFFSPSGYENSLRYTSADVVAYIPLDTGKNALRFYEITKPSFAVIMRYDIWPNHVWVAAENNVPVFLVDATMRDKTAKKNIITRSFHRSLYGKMARILTISESDLKNFRYFGTDPSRLIKIGDTRFDRVYERSRVAKTKNLINSEITAGKLITVAGSTWEEDEEVLVPVIKKLLEYHSDLLFILVPHEPTVYHIEKLEADFRGVTQTIRFSHLNNYRNEQVIIVDSIGILLTLYSYCDIAFVGGSFKSNVHNVLEAAVYGVPVIYGPKINNSQEVGNLTGSGGGFIVRDQKQMYRLFSRLITNSAYRSETGKKAGDFVVTQIGATQIIVDEMLKIMEGRSSESRSA
ncbi:MAG: 3-deoxy-D-manno-octulosonic acid transferase [Ignavibacteriaceae bacterium]|nr:3-deoxy-D-manno-octulosonic acid transferase [Ignavibacteriaceae bacterium]NUM70552.1 3-deoxy-D-manno-octulosonic acid transferase [Ignavibacteriaceae bacterium]